MAAEPNTPAPNPPVFSAFWPLCLLAAGLVFFLAWQLTGAARQRILLVRLADQQTQLAGQAAETESRLQALTLDLLKLSRSDADAKTICAKYRITYNPPVRVPAAPPAETSAIERVRPPATEPR